LPTSEICQSAVPAYETPVADPEIRFRVQVVDSVSNYHKRWLRPAFKSFGESFKRRPSPPDGTLGHLVELEGPDAEPEAGLQAAAQQTMDLFGFIKPFSASYIGDFCWKVQRLPPNLSNILAVGCGRGAELIFLRARFPKSRIMALDYTAPKGEWANLQQALNVEFVAGDIFENLDKLETSHGMFDLVFSNHVLEHFYEPDRQIKGLVKVLIRGGVFAAGLPLAAYPYADLLAGVAKDPSSAHLLDMNWTDIGHPWKTNESDLANTLINAGLVNVVVYRRASHTSRMLPLSMDECARLERRARKVYSWTLQPVVQLLKSLFGPEPPAFVSRYLFAVDRRLWFGRHRILNDVSPEVFVTATMPG